MATQLFLRSVYSLLSGMCSIPESVSAAQKLGYDSLALVDKNVLSGVMPFKNECFKHGLKPLFGLELRVNCGNDSYPVILYARNESGFQSLMHLSSLVCTSKMEEISLEDLDRERKDCYVVLLEEAMPLSAAYYNNGDLYSALALQKEWFKDHLVALNDHLIASNVNLTSIVKPLLKQEKIPTLALQRTFYLNEEDAEEYRVLTCIKEKTVLNEKVRYEKGHQLLSYSQMKELYEEDDLANSEILAKNCNVSFTVRTSLPVYHNARFDQASSSRILHDLCTAGLKRRLKGKLTKEYIDRLQYELDVITSMKFEDYFLIVYDLILFAKKKGILVGPGRGSGAGSLVTYCLGITDIDPIRYGLLFERFLNPERITMPDIDTDFPDDRRDEVIAYLRETYGKDHVAHINAYGTLKARQVIRDVGKVLQTPQADIDSICKMIPSDPKITLQKAYDSSPLFKQKIESSKSFRDLYHISLKLEGIPRHETTHAAGVVLSKEKLVDVVPLIALEEDTLSTQYTKDYLEEIGLIKIDLLGIRNLSIISEIVEDIKKQGPFDLSKIPLDDKKTFEIIKNVNTLGVFQLESSGMMNLIRRLKPTTFEEIGMTIALFRPGPMRNIPQFIENRKAPDRVVYLHDDLKEILKETYGIIVYQEQIMAIVRKMAGFPFSKADLLRRAMSKKESSQLISLRSDFIDGCLSNGYSQQLSKQVYDLIERFADYGFNKSHSVAYALVAYQMAYLKANYPLYFYKALLNGVVGSQIKTYEYLNECRQLPLTVKGVSINRSGSSYLIEDDHLLMPFGVCKDVGSVSIEKIIEERKNGPYLDFVDSICRLYNAGVEKNIMGSLIYGGAFDEFSLGRMTMDNALPNILFYAQTHKDMSLDLDFDDSPVILPMAEDKRAVAEKEKEILGFYFSYNPIRDVKQQYHIQVSPLALINGQLGPVKGFGMIKRVKTHKTKKGDMMAFVDLNDDTADTSVVIMPNLYATYQTGLVKGKYLYFEGNAEKEASVLIKKMEVY